MNTKALLVCATLAVLLGGGHPSAHADESSPREPTRARFSDAGRLMVAGSVAGWWGSRTLYHPSNWSVSVSPSLTYFVKDRIGLGVSPSIGKGNDSDGFRVRDIGLGVHALFDIPLAERVSWLVRPVLGYSHHKRDSPPFNLQALGQFSGLQVLQSSTDQAFRFELFVPLAFHVSSSVVLGFGPYFQYDRLIGQPHTHYASPNDNNVVLGTGGQVTHSPFLAPMNNYHVGLSSFIGASF